MCKISKFYWEFTQPGCFVSNKLITVSRSYRTPSGYRTPLTSLAVAALWRRRHVRANVLQAALDARQRLNTVTVGINR